jgi:branched-chain amino acid transport system permease protein
VAEQLEREPVLSPYAESIFLTGGIWAIASIGLYVTLASGQFSVAHAALTGLGGYAAAVTAVDLGWPFAATVAVGGGVGVAFGIAMAVILKDMGGMLFGIASLAIGQAIAFSIINVEFLGGSLGFAGVPLRTGFWTVLGILGGILLVLSYLRRTRLGLALLAVGKEEAVAQALGISTLRMRIFAFGLGAGLAGVAGALLVQFIGLIEPGNLGFAAAIQLFIFVIVGGITTPWGAAAGAIGITWLLEALRFSPLDRFWILGLILVVVVVLRPKGLFVRRNIRLSEESRGLRGLVIDFREAYGGLARLLDQIQALRPRRPAEERGEP